MCIGVVEAVTLSIMLGSSVDYSMHICQAFIDSAACAGGGAALTESSVLARREQRGLCYHYFASSTRKRRHTFITSALQYMMFPVLNAGLTTAISVASLTLCSLQIAAKVGEILCLSTCTSLFFALFSLPALLAIFGPVVVHRSTRRRLCFIFYFGGFLGAGILLLYIVHLGTGLTVLGPDGSSIF